MPRSSILLTSAFLLLGLGASQAHADPYRWCAVYGGDAGGASNCGFVTIEQCRATVSGMGGFCEPNQFYTGSDEPKQKKIRRYEPR
jgi:hypothetical protein